MLTDKLCCNCRYYEGVHGVQGVAPCKRKNEMVLWNDSCDDIYQICKRLVSGTPTRADEIRSMTDEELAKFFTGYYYDGPKFWCPAQPDIGEGECAKADDCRECFLNWLKQEAKE